MAKSLESDEIRAAEDAFREFLRGRGLKYTRERQVVLRGVMRNEHHFEAEQLLLDLRAGGHRVAKATIYRTLPLLVECRIIKQVPFGGKEARYEHTYGHRPHDHMVCTRCGRIVEFDSSEASRLAATTAQASGFRALTHRFQIVGLCRECAPSAPTPTAPERVRPPAARPRRATKTPPDDSQDWVSLL